MRLSQRIAALLGAVTAIVLSATPAFAVDPIPVVHSETAVIGPYKMQVSFSDWPLSAGKSLDFTFLPADGIADHSGKLLMVNPAGEATNTPGDDLARYPRQRDRWGLDTFLLEDEGTWKFQFTMDGPQGPGSGEVAIPVGPRPGPPIEVAWVLGLLPLILMVPVSVLLLIRGHRNPRPGRWSWH
jgi:hypothetical protein